MAYPTYKRKFAAFLRQEIHPETLHVPADWLTDDNVAKFLLSLGKSTNFSPHHKKAALAAINDANRLVGVTNIFDFKHNWTQTHNVIKQWEKHLKKSSYFPKQASHFSGEDSEMRL